MTSLTVFLVLCSAVMHAGWNLLARRQRAEGLFFQRMLLVVAAAGLVPAVVSEWSARSFPPSTWAYLACSGVCCGLYFFSLGRAYGTSDFTIVYPVARSMPVILVALGDGLRGRYPSAAGCLGMMLVVCGCFLAPLRSPGDISVRRYFNRASLWMVLTAIGTVGYTLLDKMAAELVRQGPATAARYCYFFSLFGCVVYTVLRRIVKPGRGKDAAPVGWAAPALGAAFTFGGYWLVVWAYQLAGRASYILAFRQSSIIIGVILALVIYREEGRAMRVAATALIAAGLVVISLWGA